jgi:hypothetical protein
MKEESEEGIGRLYDNFYPKGEDTEETEETKECWEGTCITSMNARPNAKEKRKKRAMNPKV